MSIFTEVLRAVAPYAPLIIPFAAPAIAAGMATAFGTTLGTVGMTVASAATGAVMGNVLADVNNTSRTAGAVLGGIGGGIGGYMAGPMQPRPEVGLSIPGTTPSASPALTLPGTTTSGLTLPGTTPSASPALTLPTGYNPTSSSAPLTLSGSSTVLPTTTSTSGAPFLAGTPAFTATTLGTAASAPTIVGGAATTAAPSFGQRVIQGVKSIPGTILDRVTDPEVAADIVLKAGANLLGAYVAGPGTSPEEQQLIQQQTEELRRLQETNMDLFRQRLEWAQAITGEARYFDPEYFGLQSARAAQNRGAAVMREQTRGLTGARRQAEQRRGRLATARDVGTAFDTGYGQGAAGRFGALQAGLSAMPTAAPSSRADFSSLWETYQGANQRRTAQQTQVGSFISDITSSMLTQSRGEKEKEKETT